MTDPAITSRLLPNERIVWSGQPARGIKFVGSDLLTIPFGIFLLVFSLTWANGAQSGGAPPEFWLIGIPFLFGGLFMAGGRFPIDAWARSNTRYAVTDRWIMIVRGSPFGKFTTLMLDRLPETSLEEHPDGSGTITFGEQLPLFGSSYSRQPLRSLMPSFNPTPAFHFIPDAQQVFDQVQTLAAPVRSVARAD